MSYESSQRRRLAVAVGITAVLAPAAFLLNREGDEPDTSPPVTLVGTVPTAGDSAPESLTDPASAVDRSEPAGTDVMGTSPINLLADVVAERPDAPARIAIPRLPHSVSGPATFSRNISQATDCMVTSNEVPFGSRVTVTNLDNHRSIGCINRIGGTRPVEIVVLHPDAFLQIGDLTDAPVPVQVTW